MHRFSQLWFVIFWLGLSLPGAWADAGNTLEAQGNTGNALAPGESANTSNARAESAVPVLCYHRLGNYGEKDPYFVSAAEFKRQLDIIKSEGFTPITVSALLAGWAGKAPLPEKPLLITIDDGYADFAGVGLVLTQTTVPGRKTAFWSATRNRARRIFGL